MNNRTLQKRLTQIHKEAITMVVAILCSLSVYAQEITVTGSVTGADDGEPIPGASILIKGTTSGTVTDLNGKYSIKASVGDVFVVSFVGMEAKEVKVSVSNILDVVLEISIQELDQVVVIGYGTQRKKEVTGAVARLTNDDINKIVTSDLATSLQGQIAGVNVVASSGAPGASANILIRGITSVAGGNTPLFVVDGVPQDGDPRLSNNEIETIDVLKDAASAAIYGTRGAAGVILITTKNGQPGDPKISFDASYGINKITSTINTLNTAEELYFRRAVGLYSTTSESGTGVDRNPEWINNDNQVLDFVQNDNALTRSYNFNITGGQNNFSYNANFGYYDQEGSLINSFLKRFNGRITTRYNKEKLNIRTSISYAREKNERTSGNMLLRGLRYSAYQPFFDPSEDVILSVEGTSPASESARNFLYELKRTDTRLRGRFNGSVDLSYKVIKGLTFRSILGGGVTDITDEEFLPPVIIENTADGSIINDPARATIQMDSRQQTNWAFTNMLTYTKRFKGHHVTGLASFVIEELTNEQFSARREGVSDPLISVLDGATLAERAFSGGFNFVNRTVGLIGRLQYDYKGKYLFSSSVRRDGSSKFGEENRWGTFPSVSVGWNVSEEPFWSSVESVANSLKIRASYGSVGNESFGNYAYSAVISTGSNYLFSANESLGASLREYANANIKWESSLSSNFGLDLGLFDNKLTIAADYYDTRKENMLFQVTVPPSAGVFQSVGVDPGSGIQNVVLNVGNMTNKGIELAANYKLLKGDMSLNFGLTYARNRNQVTEIFGDTEKIFNQNGFSTLGDINSTVSVTAVGYEAGAFFLHETDGVIKTAEQLAGYQVIVPGAKLGDLIYIDANDDGAINTDDQVYAGSGLPDYELGFNTNAAYKGFDFSMQWYASVGNEVINGAAAYAYTNGRHKGLTNMWTPVNTESELPIYRGPSTQDANYSGTTDLWIEDGSFVRLRLLTLGYTLPKSILNTINFDKARVYVSAQNPITITEYSGFDPEVGGTSLIQKGIDRGNYPISSQVLFGLQLTF